MITTTKNFLFVKKQETYCQILSYDICICLFISVSLYLSLYICFCFFTRNKNRKVTLTRKSIPATTMTTKMMMTMVRFHLTMLCLYLRLDLDNHIIVYLWTPLLIVRPRLRNGKNGIQYILIFENLNLKLRVSKSH